MNWVYGLFGVVFFGFITLVEVLMITLTDDAPLFVLIPFLGIFQAIGIVFLIFFVRGLYRSGKEREALMLGSETTAELIRCATNTSVNGRAYYYVMFSFVGREGFVTYKTLSVYSAAEAEYLEALKTFSIKYHGKHAVITEDFSKMNEYFARMRNAGPAFGEIDMLRQNSNERLEELLRQLESQPTADAMEGFLSAQYQYVDAETFMALVKRRDQILRMRGQTPPTR